MNWPWGTCKLLPLLLHLFVLALAHEGHHEPNRVQYCGPQRFCMAQAAFSNPATSNHDLYITLHVDGYDSSGHGWTAIGLGSEMQGALIFVVYGNPESHEKPTLSVRTTMEGHHPPLPFSADYAQGVEVQLVYARWIPVGDQYRAVLNLVCYNCTVWPGTTIDATSNAQPWIWAHNPTQPFEAHSEDALLEMHSRDAGSGFGFFFTDMVMSISGGASPPEFPDINEKQGSNGAAAESADVAASVAGEQEAFRRRAWQVHGLLLTVAFLGIYPLGVILLRRQLTDAFKMHWIVQMAASVCMALGVLLGIYLHPEIEHLHQLIGLALFVAPTVQMFLGWRHHVVFVDTGRRTLFSSIHITMGRVVLGMGAANILLGMLLKQWSALWIILLGVFAALEALGLAMVITRAKSTAKSQIYAQLQGDDDEGAFVLDDVESSPDVDEVDMDDAAVHRHDKPEHE